MVDLAYYAQCAVEGRHPAADEAMLELERAGLLTIADVGWGHRSVTLTEQGRIHLKERA